MIEQTVRVRFEDGAEVSRQTLGETRREPVEEVIGIGPAVVPPPRRPPLLAPGPGPARPRRGARPGGPPRSATAPAPSGGPEGARRSMSMVATAYDPGPASTGKSPGHPAYGITASGMRAGYGVVAVDPRVIPWAPPLHPGYGNAIAGDTGSHQGAADRPRLCHLQRGHPLRAPDGDRVCSGLTPCGTSDAGLGTWNLVRRT